MKPTIKKDLRKVTGEATLDGVALKRKIFDYHDGWAFATADIVFADGTAVRGIVNLCVQDSCEHWGTFVGLPNGKVVEQGEDGFEEALKAAGITKVFPYRYRYTKWQQWATRDHHIDDTDGWSR